MSEYNRDLQLPRMDLQMKVQAGRIEPPTAAYIFVGDMIKISTHYKEHHTMTASNPDSSETKPHSCLLGKLSQDPPAPHLVHPPEEHPCHSSVTAALFFLPSTRQKTKWSELGHGWVVSLSLLLFNYLFLGWGRWKTGELFIILSGSEELKGLRQVVQELFCPCHCGVWDLQWRLAVHRVERLEIYIQIIQLPYSTAVNMRGVTMERQVETVRVQAPDTSLLDIKSRVIWLWQPFSEGRGDCPLGTLALVITGSVSPCLNCLQVTQELPSRGVVV